MKSELLVTVLMLTSSLVNASQNFEQNYGKFATGVGVGVGVSTATGLAYMATGGFTTSGFGLANTILSGLYGGGVGVVFTAAIVGAVVGVNELVQHFQQESGAVNGTLYEADTTISYYGEIDTKDVKSCVTTSRRLFPLTRRDLDDYRYVAVRGGCTPKDFTTNIMMPMNGNLYGEPGSYRNKLGHGKRIFAIELKDVDGKADIVWRRLDK